MMQHLNYSHKILLIEDEKNLIDIYHDVLERENIQLLSTDNIEDGLMICKKEKPELVLLDLILPVTNGVIMNLGKEEGFRFMELVKKDKDLKDLSVVIFTNLDTRMARQTSKELGAIDYIVKANYTPKQVVKEILKFLN